MAVTRLDTFPVDRPFHLLPQQPVVEVTTLPQALAALRRLTRPGAPRWAVTGWAGTLVGPWSEGPRVGDHDKSELSLRQLVYQLEPEPARMAYPEVVVPPHLSDATEIDFYVRSKQVGLTPHPVIDHLPNGCVQMPGADAFARFLHPNFARDARVLGLHSIWEHRGEPKETDLDDLLCLARILAGPGRWFIGRYALHSPSRACFQEGKSAGERQALSRWSAVDPETVVRTVTA